MKDSMVHKIISFVVRHGWLAGDRAERARLESKAENKGFVPILVSLRMSENALHGNDTRQVSYDCYVLLSESTEEVNPMNGSFLVRRRATMTPSEFLSPSEYVITTPQPGIASSPQNMSIEKRAAHLLSGEHVPMRLLESILHTSDATPKWIPAKRSDTVQVLNFTPHDGGLELGCLKANMRGPAMWRACSIGMDALSSQVVGSRVGRAMLLDWKDGNFKLQPEPSLKFQARLPESDRYPAPEQPVFTIMGINEEGRPTISNEWRRKWSSDPVYGPEWCTELKKADEIATGTQLMAPSQNTAGDASQNAAGEEGNFPAEWEPQTLPLEAAHVCASDIQNLSIVIVGSGDDLKVYIKADEALVVKPSAQGLFRMGPAEWFKPPKSTRLLATGPGTEKCLHIFECNSDTALATWLL